MNTDAVDFLKIFSIALGGALALSASAETKLFWTATDGTGAYVVCANSDGSSPANIVSGAANILGPNGLETANGLLYWPDQQLNAVRQANPDGSGVTSFAAAVTDPYDVFGAGTQVYWTSRTANYVDRKQTNGSGYLRLLSSPNVTAPFAVEVTSSNLYWSRVDSGSSGSIIRSDLNGANQVTLIPNVVVYDFQVTSNYLYFADIRFPGGALKRANLDGTGITNLVVNQSGGVDLIHGLCVTSNAIYWAEYNTFTGGGIRRANLDGSSRIDLYNAPPNTGIRGVVVLDVATAPPTVPAPVFTNAAAGPAGFAYTLLIQPGNTYRVYTSANLTNWTEITNFLGAGTSITFTNPIPPGATSLFFRARTP